jgi:hypothetical protein
MSIRGSVACIVRSSLVQETTLAISAIAAHMGEPTNLTAALKKHFAVLPREPGEVAHAPGGSCAMD